MKFIDSQMLSAKSAKLENNLSNLGFDKSHDSNMITLDISDWSEITSLIRLYWRVMCEMHKETKMQVFVDLDGVLADFDAHHETLFGFRPDKKANDVDWKQIRRARNFYLGIPPMPDMQQLWDYVARLSPIVLTGIPSSIPEAASNKKEWVARHIGKDVEVRCCLSKEKCLHASSGDILIDDWEKYRSLWIAAGGRWITHVNARESIASLQALGL